jgi:hypothetical protein
LERRTNKYSLSLSTSSSSDSSQPPFHSSLSSSYFSSQTTTIKIQTNSLFSQIPNISYPRFSNQFHLQRHCAWVSISISSSSNINSKLRFLGFDFDFGLLKQISILGLEFSVAILFCVFNFVFMGLILLKIWVSISVSFLVS